MKITSSFQTPTATLSAITNIVHRAILLCGVDEWRIVV